MLKYWLTSDRVDPSPYVFGLINFSERSIPNQGVKSYLGQEILTSYRNLDFLKLHFSSESKQKLVDYLKEYVLCSRDSQIERNVGQGDFGEILATLIVSHFLGLTVPLRKLRWKFNKNRSLFCTDMIAHNPDTAITDIYYYEVKSRLTIRKEKAGNTSNYIAVNAHNSLLKDEQASNEGIADFLARYYFEVQDFDASDRYMNIIKEAETYQRHFELFFVVEKGEFKSDILDELESLPPSLRPLSVTVVLIDGLAELIAETNDLAIDAAIGHVHGES